MDTTNPATSQALLMDGLRAADTENTRAVIRNPDLFSFLLANFNNTIKLASGKPADVAIGLAGKALATGKLVGKSSGSGNIVVGVTVAQILVTSAGLVTVASKGPGGAMISIGAAFAKKTSLALSLAGNSDKRAKCLAAATDLVASALTTVAFVPTAPSGIGTVLLAGSVAQLLLSGYNAQQACLAD